IFWQNKSRTGRGCFADAPMIGRVRNSLVEQFRTLNWSNIARELEFGGILSTIPTHIISVENLG
ncbi:MAG TPA: hypothetical protein PLQ20_02935, partial [Candidatus Paceibacterota bacterium]|nr:hypothetical protein [Candidatus Paceibacterota bacterium]